MTEGQDVSRMSSNLTSDPYTEINFTDNTEETKKEESRLSPKHSDTFGFGTELVPDKRTQNLDLDWAQESQNNSKTDFFVSAVQGRARGSKPLGDSKGVVEFGQKNPSFQQDSNSFSNNRNSGGFHQGGFGSSSINNFTNTPASVASMQAPKVQTTIPQTNSFGGFGGFGFGSENFGGFSDSKPLSTPPPASTQDSNLNKKQADTPTNTGQAGFASTPEQTKNSFGGFGTTEQIKDGFGGFGGFGNTEQTNNGFGGFGGDQIKSGFDGFGGDENKTDIGGFAGSNNVGFGTNSGGFGGGFNRNGFGDGFSDSASTTFRGRGRGRGRGFRGRGGFGGYGDRGGFGAREGGFGDRGGFRGRGRGFRGGFGGGFSDRNSSNMYGKPQGFSNPGNFGHQGEFNPSLMFSNPMPPQVPKTEVKESPKQTYKQQNIPKASMCWPEAVLCVLGVQISITQRALRQHRETDILVIAYRNLKMDLYGGNIISSCSIDYRQKIENKQKQGLLSEGKAYIQKCIGIDNFKSFAFVRIDKDDANRTFVSGLLDLITQLQANVNIPRKKIVITLDKELGDFREIYKLIVKSIRKATGVQKVVFTTVQQGLFSKCLQGFAELYEQYRSNNQISLQ